MYQVKRTQKGELAEFDPKFTGKRPLPPRNGSSSRSSSGKNWYGIISSRSFPERPERLSLTKALACESSD
ncbi:MAG: hypothetical protein ACLR2E_24430 [Lachnospiraceae bacterium]